MATSSRARVFANGGGAKKRLMAEMAELGEMEFADQKEREFAARAAGVVLTAPVAAARKELLEVAVPPAIRSDRIVDAAPDLESGIAIAVDLR